MKKIIQLGILAAALTASYSTFAASTDGVQVNFSGKLVSSSCNVSINGGQGTIDMGNVDTSGLKAGDTTTEVPFTVDISGCPSSVSSAALDFEGTAAAGNHTLFGLTSSIGNASDQIAMVLKNTKSGGVITPNVSSSKQDLDNGAASIPLTAQMQLIGNTVDEGNFTVSTSLHVIYD